MEKIWDSYETDRAYILKLLGFSPFECDNFSHTLYKDLPQKIKASLDKFTVTFP